MKKSVKAAILGFGTVGSGVARTLTMNRDEIARRTGGGGVELRYIVDLRSFPDSPFASLVTPDFTQVEKDPDVRIVCECIGGTGAAYAFTKRCLLAGKHVVTSNKELVATYGCELFRLAEENGVSYLFEASVGGGIPLIRPLYRCLAANSISEICGILNGTTNYILTNMLKNGKAFADALREAQAMGYAEADPAADIDGIDVCRKISILASLVSGIHVAPDRVETEGIRQVTREDMEAADAAGFRIKLLGRASFRESGTTAFVAPHAVPRDQLLAQIDGVTNGVMIAGNAVGSVLLTGPGAGMLPTASAVCGDVVELARDPDTRIPIGWEEAEASRQENASGEEYRWLIRSEKPLSVPSLCSWQRTWVTVTGPMTRQARERLEADAGPISAYRILDI